MHKVPGSGGGVGTVAKTTAEDHGGALGGGVSGHVLCLVQAARGGDGADGCAARDGRVRGSAGRSGGRVWSTKASWMPRWR